MKMVTTLNLKFPTSSHPSAMLIVQLGSPIYDGGKTQTRSLPEINERWDAPNYHPRESWITPSHTKERTDELFLHHYVNLKLDAELNETYLGPRRTAKRYRLRNTFCVSKLSEKAGEDVDANGLVDETTHWKCAICRRNFMFSRNDELHINKSCRRTVSTGKLLYYTARFSTSIITTYLWSY